MSGFFTVGDLARITGERRSRVAYGIEVGGISPVRRVGHIRLFSSGQLPQIREALSSIRPCRRGAWRVQNEQR